MFSDVIVIFDPGTINDRATFDVPYQYPDGIHSVVVNGTVVLHQGETTGELSGQSLKSTGINPEKRKNTLCKAILGKQIGAPICYIRKQYKIMTSKIKHYGFAFLGLLLMLVENFAQSPTHIDTRRKDPNPFSLDDIILYIVFPLLLFIAVYMGRRYQKKLQEKKNAPED